MNGRGESIRACVKEVVEAATRRTELLRPSEKAEAYWEAGEALRRLAKQSSERGNPSGHFRMATAELKAALPEGA